ncbi:Thermostable carboxypeptidase 1 [Aquimixticola soesokkakensis]|uniref:Metal-dependent carboxypeptidase n=1 Tax=Aquimixticola soesokkakensis TaxID=1519096 RepID=A0A1Y5SIK4_9RHOB|nr:carboxypeptidase M32 [Aquimixticola soesokkakensis]SLN40967.1 Thermostable carboxypeptidase 1 [Aquimixticola soesokkakensis]
MTAFDDLMAFQHDTEALAQVAGRLGWDQETVMPRGAANQRGEEIAALETVLHARRTDPRLGDWLERIDDARLPPADRAKLRHIRTSYARNTKVPAKLAAELARVTSVSQGIWAQARASDDYNAFAPTFETVLRLKREEASALAEGGDLYDALLQDYEPGTTAAELDAMFGALRPRLVALRDRILGADQPLALQGHFPAETQMALSADLATSFGYDLSKGRIDRAVHPFSSGSGADVRITTRTDEADPFNCFYSTIHEVGHACYEQNIDPEFALTPLGAGVSMGVHESQSRIYENQIGRSPAFTRYLFRRMSEKFGALNLSSPDAFTASVNRVTQGFIRTESDEVQYNLHVLLRFDLERDLIAGRLDVADLPEAWNTRFAADFGVTPDRVSKGCLQDVHWPVGLFGYFPTYSLGNVYAGCLMQAMRAEVGGLDAAFERGDTRLATDWLREKVQQFGGLYTPRDTIKRACGFEPNEGPLLDYLEAKFAAIYGF